MKLSSIIRWGRSLASSDPVVFALTGLACIAVAGTVIFVALSVIHAPQRATAAKVAAHAAQVETKVQAIVSQQAVATVERRAAREAHTQQQHEENSRAFKQLPSAGMAIPDSDADAFARRECVWDNQRGSSACAGL